MLGETKASELILPTEGVNAPKHRGRPKLETRGGRREGAMKYPLRTATKSYLAMREELVQRSTFDNESRILWHLVGVLEDMKSKGELATNNPWKMGRNEIRAILDRLKDGDRPLENDTMDKYIRYLEGLLGHCGNHVIEGMKKDAPNLFPRRGRKPIAHLNEDQVGELRNAAEEIDGRNGAILRFVTAIYPATGLRPSELRKARLEDLNIETMTLKVRHPRGRVLIRREESDRHNASGRGADNTIPRRETETCAFNGIQGIEIFNPKPSWGKRGDLLIKPLLTVKEEAARCNGNKVQAQGLPEHFCILNGPKGLFPNARGVTTAGAFLVGNNSEVLRRHGPH